MKIIKIIAFCLAAITLFSFVGCGEQKPVLNVYNWGDYMDPDVITEFEKEYGVKVKYDTFTSNEDMYAKISAGGVNYDIAIPSDYMIEKMINQNLVEEINLNNVPNYKNIDSRFKNLAYDPDNKYSVAFTWGVVGILYNKTKVTEPVDSWNILWDEKYENEIYMYNSQRDSLAPSFKRLGYSLNSVNPTELEEAKNELIKQRPLVQAYLDDAVKDNMIGNQGSLAVVYSGDAVYCMDKNPDLAFAFPKEGTNVFYDAVIIPKGAKNKELAEKFIDFLCRDNIALKNTEYIGFSTTNAETYKQLPIELKENPAYWVPEDVVTQGEVYKDLGEFIKEYDKAWTEICAQ